MYQAANGHFLISVDVLEAGIASLIGSELLWGVTGESGPNQMWFEEGGRVIWCRGREIEPPHRSPTVYM